MIQFCEQYLNVLELLCKRILLSRATIYPAIGVDAFPVLYANKIVEMNWRPYNVKKILEHLSPILPRNVTAQLKSRLENKLTFIPRIDVSRLDLVFKQLQTYKSISPKSVVLKGVYENAFLYEW